MIKITIPSEPDALVKLSMRVIGFSTRYPHESGKQVKGEVKIEAPEPDNSIIVTLKDKGLAEAIVGKFGGHIEGNEESENDTAD